MLHFDCRIEIGKGPAKACVQGKVHYRFNEHAPESLALVCQVCGNLWCRLVTLGEETGFFPIPHLCPDCGDGTLCTLRFDYRYYDLPPELYAREVKLWGLRKYPQVPNGIIYA